MHLLCVAPVSIEEMVPDVSQSDLRRRQVLPWSHCEDTSHLAMSPHSAHDGEQLLPPQPRESHAQKVVVNLEMMRSQVELAA